MKKTKILLVSHSMSRTGAPRVILNIANELNPNIYDVAVFNVNSTNEQLSTELNKNITLRRVNPYLINLSQSRIPGMKFVARVIGKFINVPKTFKRTLREFKPDLVLINTIYHLYLSDITNELSIKTIRYIHELESYQYSLSETDKQKFLESQDHIWACSEKVKNILTSYYNKEDVEIVYPLVKIQKYQEKANRRKAEQFKVISAGAVDFRKGFDLWVDVAVKALSLNDNILFEWYGSLENEQLNYFSYCMKKIPDGYKNKILYKGEVNDLQDKLINADLFFLSSREDPFPIVVLESLANGLPSVGFASGGICELEDRGVSRSVELGDKLGLSKLIVDFANSKIKIEASQCVMAYNEFDFCNIFSRIEMLFDNVINIH